MGVASMAKVSSNIYLTEKNGAQKPTVIGEVPDMDEESALESYRRCCGCFKRGKGLLANHESRKAERIACMEKIVAIMASKRIP